MTGFLTVLIRYQQLVALLGLSLGILGILLGALLLTRFAYDVSVDPDGLLLRFAFLQKRVVWDEVEWYRKVGVTWGFKIVGSDLNAGIFILVKCLIDGRRHPFRACLWIEGYGPGFSRSSEEFVTPFDQHAPEKNWRKVSRPPRTTT